MSTGASGYFLGRTTSIACQADPRFSYCLHVPKGYARRASPARLLVAVHDTGRANQSLRDRFSEFAEATNTVVVAPLFAAGIGDPNDVDHYKYLRHQDLHFDRVLLSMVSEVTARYGLSAQRFSVFGFSGGAHVAHRLLYVHPEHLAAVVVASPGSVTLASTEYSWWPGLSDFEAIFGREVPWDEICQVPVHLVVGAKDTDPRGIVQTRDNPLWVEGALAAGVNRVERLRTLYRQLGERGAKVTFEELDGVDHQLQPAIDAALRYLPTAIESVSARAG